MKQILPVSLSAEAIEFFLDVANRGISEWPVEVDRWFYYAEKVVLGEDKYKCIELLSAGLIYRRSGMYYYKRAGVDFYKLLSI